MSDNKNSAPLSGIPPRQRRMHYLRRFRPLLVWLLVLIASLALYLRREGGVIVTGYAEEIRYSVAPETAGGLKELQVGLHERVVKGQIVAALDDKALMLELKAAGAELDRDRALWELEIAGLAVEQQTNLRRYARDVSSTRIEYLDTLAELAEDRITLQGLELTLNRTRELEAGEYLPRASLDDARTAHEALAEKVRGLEELAATQLAAHEAADLRYKDFLAHHIPGENLDSGSPLRSLAEAFEAQEARIEGLNLAIDRLLLRAPADGRVAEILHRPGDVLGAGETVLTILQPHSSELIAYLPEQRILGLEPGAKVRLRRVADPGRRYVSSVASLGAAVEQMPMRVEIQSVAPRWGLAVLIPLPESLEAVPGEAFQVSF